MQLLFSAHFMNILRFIGVFSLDIFSICPSIGNIFWVPSLCNLQLQKFASLYIQAI